jgi:predicted  nucleic acid-binding Zn-ribbon protein
VLLYAQIGNLTEEKEELADELESARAVIKRKDQEIQQLRAQNEQMRAQLGGTEVRQEYWTLQAGNTGHLGSCKVAACRACDEFVGVEWQVCIGA